MPIEAIAARLFDQGAGRYSLTFERVLPLPDEGEFDLTIRKREERKRTENTARRPALLPVLVKEGLLKDGQTLWVGKTVLSPTDRPKYDPESPLFQVEVRIEDGSAPKLAWRATENEDYKLYTPSAVPYYVWKAATGREESLFYSPVATNFLLKPDGPTRRVRRRQRGLGRPRQLAAALELKRGLIPSRSRASDVVPELGVGLWQGGRRRGDRVPTRCLACEIGRSPARLVSTLYVPFLRSSGGLRRSRARAWPMPMCSL